MRELIPLRLQRLADFFGYGPPCCKLTKSGKHQRDCPRARIEELEVQLAENEVRCAGWQALQRVKVQLVDQEQRHASRVEALRRARERIAELESTLKEKGRKNMTVKLIGGPLEGNCVQTLGTRTTIVIATERVQEGYMARYRNRYGEPRDEFRFDGIVQVAKL
jgi:hypothetical protein